MMQALTDQVGALAGTTQYGAAITHADIFSYKDPIDGSTSKNQGIRIYFADGGRIVFRLSGTGTSGATLRVYLDKIEKDIDRLELPMDQALGSLAAAAADIAAIEKFTGLGAPTAII
jgi:phosphoglucomutase